MRKPLWPMDHQPSSPRIFVSLRIGKNNSFSFYGIHETYETIHYPVNKSAIAFITGTSTYADSHSGSAEKKQKIHESDGP